MLEKSVNFNYTCLYEPCCGEPGHLLFIIVLEVLTCEIHSGVPWEDLYADDFIIIADLLEECVRRIRIWKKPWRRRG